MKLKYNVEIDIIPNDRLLSKEYYFKLFAQRIKKGINLDDYNRIKDIKIEGVIELWK